MTKRIVTLILAAIVLLSFAGCKKSGLYPDLPWDAISFDIGEYSPMPGIYYSSIKWGERTYIPYGKLSRELQEGDLTNCLGYTKYNNEEDKNSRVFTLKGDNDHNYLIIIHVDNSAYVPEVYRALDTKDKEVKTPDFIESTDRVFWK